MLLSMSDIQKKRGRPATGKTPIAAVRLADDLRSALDRAIADEADSPSRSELIRRVLTSHLRAKGYLPATSGDTS